MTKRSGTLFGERYVYWVKNCDCNYVKLKTSKMAKKAKSGATVLDETRSVLPGTLDWDSLIEHANHVRNILLANNRSVFVYYTLDPEIDAVNRGIRTAQQKKNLQKAVLKGIEDYSYFFKDDKTLFLT